MVLGKYFILYIWEMEAFITARKNAGRREAQREPACRHMWSRIVWEWHEGESAMKHSLNHSTVFSAFILGGMGDFAV